MGVGVAGVAGVDGVTDTTGEPVSDLSWDGVNTVTTSSGATEGDGVRGVRAGDVSGTSRSDVAGVTGAFR